MKTEYLIGILIGINLVVGNFILLVLDISHLVTSFISGNETMIAQIILHLLCSTIAVLQILWVARLIRSRRRMVVAILAYSFVSALLVPFLSTYVLFFGYALVRIRPDMLVPALFVAIASTLQSIQYWLPFALVNSVFLLVYNQRQNGKSAANQAL